VVVLLESFLSAGVTQAMAFRVDWSKWRLSLRGTQESPLLEHIIAAGDEGAETSGAKSDWRLKIESAAPEDRTKVIEQAVRDVVGSVLRVKPEGLRADQPLTDLGLDSLMAVEIENSIESAIGVALPPASLMLARTIGQIATLIAEHMSGTARVKSSAASVLPAKPEAIDEVDLKALSDDAIDRLLGDATPRDPTELMQETRV
jgi:acyl carrier protein